VSRAAGGGGAGGSAGGGGGRRGIGGWRRRCGGIGGRRWRNTAPNSEDRVQPLSTRKPLVRFVCLYGTYSSQGRLTRPGPSRREPTAGRPGRAPPPAAPRRHRIATPSQSVVRRPEIGTTGRCAAPRVWSIPSLRCLRHRYIRLERFQVPIRQPRRAMISRASPRRPANRPARRRSHPQRSAHRVRTG
jgi:hypothetical protein